MGPWAKLAIAALVLFVVGSALAIGGVYYVAHRISRRVHEVTGGPLGSDSSSSSSADASTSNINPCSLLSKEDVTKAIGVKIIRADRTGDSCSYIAQGDQADMTAKHATAMASAHGADQKSQQLFQNFAGAIFKNAENEHKQQSDTPDDHPGEVPVLSFSVDQNAAQTQMDLNNKVLGILGPAGAQNIAGIGDQAFVSGESMLMVRKRNTLIRIMYMTCPCNTEAIKPLARKIADAL
jgi:hypothetical protein